MKQSEVNALCSWLENNSIPETNPDGHNTYPMIRAAAVIRYLFKETLTLQLSLEHCLQKQHELSKQKASRSGS